MEEYNANFPFKIEPVTNSKAKEFHKNIYENDYVLVGPKKYCLPKLYQKYGPIYYNLPIKATDIWMFGYPRSGTTLAQELIWLIGNDCDFNRAAADILDIRFTFFEADLFFLDNGVYEQMKDYARTHNGPVAEIAKKLSVPVAERIQTDERRYIKTHIPISLMNPKIINTCHKIFYLARNPKDVVVSNYYFTLNMLTRGEKVQLSFEEFWQQFKNDMVLWTPYFEHLKEGWNIRKKQNVMFLVYDVYSKNIRKTIMAIAKFLNKDLSEKNIDELEEHLRFDNFKRNKSVNNEHYEPILGINRKNNFIRKGSTGGWKDYFKGELRYEVEQWMRQNLLGYDELLNIFEP